MPKTTSTTGIGVRGGSASLGGLSTQPIPFVLPATFPVTRPTSPATPVVAPANIAEAITNGLVPALSIPISNVVNGTMDLAVTALLPPGLTGVQYRPSSQSSNMTIYAPSLLPRQRPNEESLSLSRNAVFNDSFQRPDPYGINQLRPEIIGMMDYEPIYYGDTYVFNDVGVLMDVQYQARHLREQTFFQLIQGIQRTDQNQQLQNIQTDFAASFRKINVSADFYKNTINTLDSVKNGFDVKSIPASTFDLRNFKTLRDFYEVFMLFPQAAFDSFSGTKVLMQLLSDMRNIAEGQSMNLLNLTDPDRQAGSSAFTSPVSIDKSYNARNGYAFTYDTIRSYLQPVNASHNQFFTRFNTSLPQAPDDRVKILVNMISKELRVSRALGRGKVTAQLRNNFAATTTDGSPFDNLIGGVGNTIFEPVTGEGSIAGLTVLNDQNGSAVLPFETRYIDANNTRKVYIPGSAFFVESIVNVPVLTSFNLEPLRTYVERFVTTTDSAASVISDLFDYGDEPSNLSPVSVLKSLLSKVSHTLTRLMTNTQRSGEEISTADAATAAIFRLATSDPTLKSMLFQFMILNLLCSENSLFFADAIVQELSEEIGNLDAVTVNDLYSRPNLRDASALQAFINTLGTTIQDRVVGLVNQQNINQLGSGPPSRRNVDTIRSDGKMLVHFDVDITYGIPNAIKQSRFTTNLIDFMVGIESTLGNEVTNILDSAQRSRYNSLSMSTIFLMAFEAYTNLISRYVKVDFQTSAYGTNFPDMLVDANFNASMYGSIERIIAEPQLALPVIVTDKSTAPKRTTTTRTPQTQRGHTNRSTGAAQHAQDQIEATARATGNSTTNVYVGLIENYAILAGSNATAGSSSTDASQFALRGLSAQSTAQDLLDYHNLDSSLNSMVLKLFQEDFAVACAMHILLVIKERLRGSYDLATNYFTQQTLNNFAASNGTALADIGRNLTPTQVRLLLRQRDSFVQQLTTNTNQLQFIPASPTDVNVKNAVCSLLNQADFRETNEAKVRYKILSVGVPSGFSKSLADRLNAETLNTTAFHKTKGYDLIYVKVYKRSLEYPQIIFKPKRFMFDMSLFSGGYAGLDIQPYHNFSSVVQRVTLQDYQNFGVPSPVTLSSILNDSGYAIIPDQATKRALFANHVISDLLSAYMQALTTMKISEETFIDVQSQTWRTLSLGNGTDLSPRFAELVRRYLIAKRTADIRLNPALRPLPDLPIQDMLTNPGVDQGTKDTLRLLTFGNIAFKPENAIAEMLSPKIFERVFNIPLNIDSFEIDYEATTGPQSGRELLEKDFIQAKLDRTAPAGTYRFKPRTAKDAVIEDFFVTIELVE